VKTRGQVLHCLAGDVTAVAYKNTNNGTGKMPTAKSIVLLGTQHYVLSIRADFRDGNGKMHLKGTLGQEIRIALLAAISAIHELDSYIEGFDPTIFAACNLHIVVSVDGVQDLPVIGESYGLALSMAVLAATINKPLPADLVYTGCIGPAGEVLPVGGITDKRRAAKGLGFSRLMLPCSQLDMMSSDIIQCPVKDVQEAFSVTFYGNG